MDEWDIEVLKANGYAYVDGGIVDAEGRYVSSLDLNGKTYTSESSIDLWQRGKDLDAKYSKPTAPKIEDLMIYRYDVDINTPLTDKKKTLKTESSQAVNDTLKSSVVKMSKYPLVLGASILIYLIAKRLIK